MLRWMSLMSLASLLIETNEITCISHEDCLSVHSFCDNHLGQCRCHPSHPVMFSSGNTAFCLKAANINQPCDFTNSCTYYDPNAVCNHRKVCMCQEGFEHRRGPFNRCVSKQLLSKFDADLSNEDDDSASDEVDEDIERSKTYEKDFVVPIVVGIVLGTIIICGWSFAICHLYLKRMKRRTRLHQRRLIKYVRPVGEPLTRAVELSRIPVTFSSRYSLVLNSYDRTSCEGNRRTVPCNLRLDSSMPEEFYLRSPSPLQSSIPFISPEEEPLPGYPNSPSKESMLEAPPSYQEVMEQMGEEPYQRTNADGKQNT